MVYSMSHLPSVAEESRELSITLSSMPAYLTAAKREVNQDRSKTVYRVYVGSLSLFISSEEREKKNAYW